MFLLLIALGALACFVDRNYLYAAGGLAAIWIPVCMVLTRREKARLMVAFGSAFGDFKCPEPKLKTESSYGFPSFTLTFKCEEDLKTAQKEGRIGLFKHAISELYGHSGSASNPFDVARAVWVTHEDWKPTSTAIT